MKKFSKLFAIVLSFMLAFSSISALAAGGTLYIMGDPIIIDGERQPSSLGMFVSYDVGKVNLSNTSLSTYTNLIEATGDFTLTLSGDNALNTTGNYALKVIGNLTISGDGNLTASAKKAAIYVEGDVTISGASKITLTGTDAESYGIYATGEITVTDSEVIASGNTENSVSKGEPLPEPIPDEDDKENNEDNKEDATEDKEDKDTQDKPSKPSTGGTPGKLPSVNEKEENTTPKKPAFSDVAVTDWFCVYVNDLTDKGVVNGYPDGTFKPQGNVTYGEALKLVARAAGLPEQPAASGHWASGYLTLAVLAGALEADQNLDLPIERKVIALLAKTFLNLPDPKNASPFADTNDAAITSLYEAGIVEGSFTDDGKRVYLPDSAITRAEISAIVYRMLK